MNTIFYKEWIKTRWYLLLAFIMNFGFILYSILRLERVINMKGTAHLWEVMITRDAIFIEILQYLPLITGIVLALFQFMPEMYHKCLKLTLHLPYPQLKMMNLMLIYGAAALIICFGSGLLILFIYLQGIFAPELYTRMFMTAMPWYIAGICAYFLISWICLEPTWKMRIFNLVVSALILKVFFLSSYPGAYSGFLIPLTIYCILTICLSWNSIYRFKCGKQD